MMTFASFNYNDKDVILALLFPFIVPVPFVMIWLEFRSIFRTEAQSIGICIALLIMATIGCIYLNPLKLPGKPFGFMAIWLWLLWLALVATPIVFGWEIHKRGLFKGKAKLKKRAKNRTIRKQE